MIHLIDKSALVVELKKRIMDYWSDSENTTGIYPYALEEVIKYVDTLEVKEVDLGEEIVKWEESFKHCPASMGYKETAKHFFELGLQAAQKGEAV